MRRPYGFRRLWSKINRADAGDSIAMKIARPCDLRTVQEPHLEPYGSRTMLAASVRCPHGDRTVTARCACDVLAGRKNRKTYNSALDGAASPYDAKNACSDRTATLRRPYGARTVSADFGEKSHRTVVVTEIAGNVTTTFTLTLWCRNIVRFLKS